jgi:polar amino acid transport system substrate-binding protein
VFRSNVLILLEDMAQGTNRIKAIVEGLRKFAKRDDGVLNDEVDLNEIIQGCLRLVANQIGRRAKVRLQLDGNLPKVKGNFQRLEQVVVNILINASQAIDKKWLHRHSQATEKGERNPAAHQRRRQRHR